MSNAFYNPTGNPATGAEGLSSLIRGEFALIGTAFDMMPQISTTGSFSTIFAQQGSYTFTLPSASGTLATTANVATETTRATAAEAVLTTAVSAEATARATAVTAETTRATAAEGVNATAISAETTRATAAEGVNATAISAETTRATAAEALLAPKASPALTGNPTAPTASVGDNDTSIATTAFVQTAIAPAFNNAGRNRLHNGSMEIAQRGTSGSTGGVTAYTLDRWTFLTSGSAGTWAKSAATGYTSRASLALNGVMQGGTFASLAQNIESARCYDLAGQTVTLQFDVTATATTSNGAPAPSYSAGLFYANSADNFGSLTSIQALTFTPTGTPATVQLTFSALPAGAANGLQLSFGIVQAGPGSVSNTVAFHITSVQLEAGSVATPYERRDPGIDLLMCQRFYQTYPQVLVSGYGAASGTCYLDFSLTAPMRAAPGVTFGTITYSNASGLAVNAANSTHVRLSLTSTALGLATAAADLNLSADL